MTRIIASIALALVCAAPAAAAERRYTLTDFDRIQVDGPFQVEVATGRSTSGIARGELHAIDRALVEVQGRTLRIRPNRSAWGAGPTSGPVRISLTTRDLRAASVNGSGAVDIDKTRSMRLDVGLAGNGRIRIGQVETDLLVLGATGGGRIAVGGKVKTLRATVRGSADLDGAGLRVEDADLQADTSGAIALAVGRAAKITASGAGDVTITGAPACTVSQTGAGLVRCGAPD